MSLGTVYLMMLYVQHRLAGGLQPDCNGFFQIRRVEFIKELPMTPSTFDRNVRDFVEKVMTQWDLNIWFHLTGLAGEKLYIDVSYSKGVLKFRRNPITERSELQYVWARPPVAWEERSFRYEYLPVPEGLALPIIK